MSQPKISYDLVMRMINELSMEQQSWPIAGGDDGNKACKRRAIVYLIGFDIAMVEGNHAGLLYLFLAKCMAQWADAVDTRMMDVSTVDNPRMVDMKRLVHALASLKAAADRDASVHHFVVFPMSLHAEGSSHHRRLLRILFHGFSLSANLTMSIAADSHFPSDDPEVRGLARFNFVVGQGSYPAGLMAARDAVLRVNKLMAPSSPCA
jgi:hypothetical protein